MFSSQIKWSPHNKDEFIVTSEYPPRFPSFAAGSGSARSGDLGSQGFGYNFNLNCRNVSLFECQNLKGFDMSVHCNFTLSSLGDSYGESDRDSSSPSQSPSDVASAAGGAASSSSSSQSNPPSPTFPSDIESDVINSASSAVVSGKDRSQESKSKDPYIVMKNGSIISNKGNRPVVTNCLSFTLNPAVKV